MKANIYILALVAFLAIGCSKSSEEKLIGKWDYSESGFYAIKSIFYTDTSKITHGATLSIRTGNVGTKAYADSSVSFEWFLTEDTAITITEQGKEPSLYRIQLDGENFQQWHLHKITTSALNATEEWFTVATLNKR
mgnify:CR=1 FL=1